MEGQFIHPRQVIKESMESRRSQSPIPPHVGTVGTHTLGTVIIKHPATTCFRRYIGRTEIVNHYHHHHKGHGNRRSYYTHRRIETVLVQLVQE